jgi:hypothetical protein
MLVIVDVFWYRLPLIAPQDVCVGCLIIDIMQSLYSKMQFLF